MASPDIAAAGLEVVREYACFPDDVTPRALVPIPLLGAYLHRVPDELAEPSAPTIAYVVRQASDSNTPVASNDPA